MKINYLLLNIFLLLIVLFPVTLAADDDSILFMTNKSDYYFAVGSDAVIPVYTTNPFNQDLSGQITFTVTETISEQGFQSSSSNTQSQPFTIQKGLDNTPIGFGFGKSDKESTRVVSMNFVYLNPETKISEKIILPVLTLHFVKDSEEQEKQEQESQEQEQQKSEKEDSTNNQQQQSQPEPSQEPQKPTDKMQESIQQSQQSQDSSALKNQVKKEVDEKKAIDEQTKKEINNNSDYQDLKSDLEEKGFKPDSEPRINEEDFNQEFTNPQTGEKANITGNLGQNNSVEEIKSAFESSKLEQDILNYNSTLNQELKQKIRDLKAQGFNESPMSFVSQNNITTFTKNLKNPITNETVKFTGALDESEIIDLNEERDLNYSLIFLWLFLLLVLGIFLYVWAKKSNFFKAKNNLESEENILEPVIDYRKEALKMIEQSKTLFKTNRKDAYELLSYSVRYYYSNKLDLGGEVSNRIVLERINKNHVLNAKKVFSTASIVEFAKGDAKEDVFNSSVSLATKLMD